MFHKEIMLLLLDKTSSRNKIISRNKYISTVKQFLKAPKRNLQAILIPKVKEVANFIYCWQLLVENSVQLSFLCFYMQIGKKKKIAEESVRDLLV